MQVQACPKVERLIGRVIRVNTPEFDGLGVVKSVKDGFAELVLDLEGEIG